MRRAPDRSVSKRYATGHYVPHSSGLKVRRWQLPRTAGWNTCLRIEAIPRRIFATQNNLSRLIFYGYAF
jgi:hypothetical protein